MIDKHIAVKDMPSEIQEACIERGHSPDDEMSIRDALGEWMGWEIGDPYKGYAAAEYVAEMATRNSIL
jgi:hypothetical protein